MAVVSNILTHLTVLAFELVFLEGYGVLSQLSIFG